MRAMPRPMCNNMRLMYTRAVEELNTSSNRLFSIITR
jgi:hypothetical protein